MGTPTPHNSAKYGDFAKTVLMPGDPMRSEFTAKNFLSDAELVNDVRGVKGYTGRYKGVTVSVMASGMGMPSIGIYSHELYSFYGVENIIRIGSAGGISDSVGLKDIVAALSACTDSNYLSKFDLDGTFAPTCDYRLLSTAEKTAENMGISLKIGSVFSTDIFYSSDPKSTDRWRDMGVLAVEMETAALYANAAYFKKNALTLCTISDHLTKGESLSSLEREQGFGEMITLALETAVNLQK